MSESDEAGSQGLRSMDNAEETFHSIGVVDRIDSDTENEMRGQFPLKSYLKIIPPGRRRHLSSERDLALPLLELQGPDPGASYSPFHVCSTTAGLCVRWSRPSPRRMTFLVINDLSLSYENRFLWTAPCDFSRGFRGWAQPFCAVYEP